MKVATRRGIRRSTQPVDGADRQRGAEDGDGDGTVISEK